MKDVKVYQTEDLVLKVEETYNPEILDLDSWENFIEILCCDRLYQKVAIRRAIIYLASGNYSSIESLVDENWVHNFELHGRYRDMEQYKQQLQLPRKLSGVIDLATGTGKSYVMYGIAQIALGLGFVDKVIVLCPSLTIESGLKEKFENLSGDDKIKATLPETVVFKNPRIVDANQTIKDGDIAVENIHAVYSRTGSSIEDSLNVGSERVLVLNDEVHHAYNSSKDKDIKKWKAFLQNPRYNFKYILGFTGTAYMDDEYFADVIYRYSIRQAVEDKVVKSVDYVDKDDSIDENEKFQKIYNNHKRFKEKYRNIKPLTIIVTKDISSAKQIQEDLVDFLEEKENINRCIVEKKVLIITSHKDHKKNILQLNTVDGKENPVEWIISVSMLTEGWDVKNVFQIVPWKERAFNSKLLISQVLGRGLRMPDEYKSPQPKVRIFNHDAWSKNIRGLVDEILEIEMRIVSVPMTSGERSKYHFDIYTIDYEKKPRLQKAKKDTEVFNYSKSFIKLVSQAEQVKRDTKYADLQGNVEISQTLVQRKLYRVDEVVHKIIDTFKNRDFEAKIRFPKGMYDKENLPPESEIKEIIVKSMNNVGIVSELLTDDNTNRVYNAFQTLFRKRGSTIVFEKKIKQPIKISTKDLDRQSLAVGNLRKGATVFYADTFNNEIDAGQKDILEEIIKDKSFIRSASKEVKHYSLKTPVSVVLTKHDPEREFVEAMVNDKVYTKIDSWIKSRDQNFYSIEYTWRKGEHQTQGNFNPDFFIKLGDNIVVIEIKDDDDDSDENKAKFRWAKQHFNDLNVEMKKRKIKQRYFFHFLSKNSYDEFMLYLLNGKLFKGEFYSALEARLDS